MLYFDRCETNSLVDKVATTLNAIHNGKLLNMKILDFVTPSRKKVVDKISWMFGGRSSRMIGLMNGIIENKLADNSLKEIKEDIWFSLPTK